MLGKRDAPETVDEAATLLEAVTNQVKRNRRANHPNDAPVTLQERRAYDRATINTVIRDH